MNNHHTASRRTASGRAAAAAAALLLGLGLSACGGESGGEGASTTAAAATSADVVADPCTLVGQDALEEALGVSLNVRGPASDEALGRACHWDFPDRPGIPGSLSLTLWHGAQFFSTSVGEPLTGIGDQAQGDATLGLVLFRSGEEVVQVQLQSPAHRDAASAVARLAAAQV